MFVSKRVRAASIEALESRIAPALLVNGANLLGGAGNPTTGETSIGKTTSVELVHVLSGQALVWFDASTGDITSISFGPNTRLDITGNVDGDIIGNLTGDGLLTDSNNNAADGEDGGILLPNNLLGLTTHPLSNQDGDIGHVVTGGSISNVSVTGKLQGLYAGDGVFRFESNLTSGGNLSIEVGMDLNPVLPDVQSHFDFTKATSVFQPGADITQVTTETGVSLQLIAGGGDPQNTGSASAAGHAGGSVSFVNIKSAIIDSSLQSATTSYSIYAGHGGKGSTGGAGGLIRNVTETKAAVTATMIAGDGGEGLNGRGGAGGNISSIDLQSDSTSYIITAGNGGKGTPGGAGGSVINSKLVGNNPNSTLIVSGDFNGDGADDVLVVDSGTGAFIVSKNNGTGTDFTPIVQHAGADGEQVQALGATPVDAAAADMDGDGDLDLVVAYSNSNSVAVYYNDGTGRFYDNTDALQSASFGVGGSPDHIAVGNFDGTSSKDIAVFTTDIDGRHVGVFTNQDDLSFAVRQGSVTLDGDVADLAVAKSGPFTDEIILGFTDGFLRVLTPNAAGNPTPFTVVEADDQIAGGIASIDLDGEGGSLVVLSASGSAASQTLTGFSVAGSSLTLLGTTNLAPISDGHALSVAFLNTEAGGDFDNVVVLQTLDSGTGAILQSYSLTDQLVNGQPTPVFSPVGDVTAGTSLKSIAVLNTHNAFADEPDAQAIAGIGSILTKFSFVDAGLNTVDESALNFASKTINITAGNGGDGTDLARLAGKGGAGGNIMNVNLESSAAFLIAGNGGGSILGTAGAGGSIFNNTVLNDAGEAVSMAIKAKDSLTLHAGNGGSSAGASGKIANAGAGGSVQKLSLQIEDGLLDIAAGNGGFAVVGKGGLGGSVNKIRLNVGGVAGGQQNGTNIVTIHAGGGGGGATGGAGGSVSGLNTDAIHDQKTDEGTVILTRFVLSLSAGDGGAGTNGNGGAGGSILQGGNDFIRGVTDFDTFDPANISLTVNAGNGASGSKLGGAGGNIVGLVAQNSQFSENTNITGTHLRSAVLVAGSGGSGGSDSGGAGGSISRAQVAVQGGILGAIAGDGGNTSAGGKAKGGVGGSVGSSYFGTVDTELIILGGQGGLGVSSGGAGGTLTGIEVNTPQSLDGFAAILKAGDGGLASGSSGIGGKGGDINGIKQSKDLNSSIDLIAAGAGGDALAGKGGAGGNVNNVKTIGYIGKPSDGITRLGAFHTVFGPGGFALDLAQGLFAGQGGAGASSSAAGAAGSVNDVKARGIASIGAIHLDDFETLSFAAATKVSNVTAGLIGYDVNQNGLFDTDAGTGISPTASTPIDGFILAKALSKVTTFAANFSFTA